MRIANLETFVLGTNRRNLVFVRLTTDEGLTGVGEASLTNLGDAVVGYLGAATRNNVLGSDPFDVEDLGQRMIRNDFWRGGVVAYTGISAVEIACWDIIGKALGWQEDWQFRQAGR